MDGVPPVQTWDGYPPVSWMGYPHLNLGWGTPHQLNGVPPTWTWDWVSPSAGWGIPPPQVWTDTDSCQNIIFFRTSYAGGNNYGTFVQSGPHKLGTAEISVNCEHSKYIHTQTCPTGYILRITNE